MKEIPILFSTPMVQAILAGRKTQTRRILKDNCPELLGYQHVTNSPTYPEMWKGKKSEPYTGWVAQFSNLPIAMPRKCPYGKPGDILWVRESWSPKYVKGGLEGFKMTYPNNYPWIYKADNPEAKTGYAANSWKPSIHMAKDAARIWLQVENVRVERLQDISRQDSRAEGILYYEERGSTFYKDYLSDASGYGHPDHDYPTVSTAVESYKTLWQSINGENSWEENPFVWVIEYKTISTAGKPY